MLNKSALMYYTLLSGLVFFIGLIVYSFRDIDKNLNRNDFEKKTKNFLKELFILNNPQFKLFSINKELITLNKSIDELKKELKKQNM